MTMTEINTPESASVEENVEPLEAVETAETVEDVVAEPEAAEFIEKAKYTELEDKFKALNDQHMRLAADFENFRKRTVTERENLRKYAAEGAIEALLPVLDNLERGESSLSEDSDAKTLYQSFSMLTKQLLDALQSQGLKKVDMVGQPFDPEFCEALSQMPSNDHPENTVIQTVQSGFQLHDRVVRPARVVVSTGAPAAAEPASGAVEENPFSNA